jgi:acyl-ACP thioesterase
VVFLLGEAEDYMYTMKSNIRYSECGADNKLKIPALINYFQDCTTENSEKIGAGYTYLKRKKRAWILNAWNISIFRRPEVGESVEISTWATGFKGVFGPRDFQMKTAKGELLACAKTLWVYLDTESGRPTKPTEEEMAAYQVEPSFSEEIITRKLKLPEEMEYADTFPVGRYQIDTNQHVNNSQYVQVACEVIPGDYSVKEVRVEYRKAAVFGDVFVVKQKEEEGKIVVSLCDEEDIPYAIVEFIGER